MDQKQSNRLSAKHTLAVMLALIGGGLLIWIIQLARAGVLDRLPCHTGRLVHRARVEVLRLEVGLERLDDLGSNRRGGVVVEVDVSPEPYHGLLSKETGSVSSFSPYISCAALHTGAPASGEIGMPV